MGGRRSYSLTEVFGKSAKVARSRRKVSQALDEKSAAGIAASAAGLLLGSDKQIRLLSEAARAFRTVVSEARKQKPETYEARRRAANAAWAKEKTKRQLQTTLKEDRIVTESLARTLRRKRRRR